MTAQGKVTAAQLTPGMVIMVTNIREDENGKRWADPSRTKVKDAVRFVVFANNPGTPREITGHTVPGGNDKVTVAAFGHNTFWLAPGLNQTDDAPEPGDAVPTDVPASRHEEQRDHAEEAANARIQQDENTCPRCGKLDDGGDLPCCPYVADSIGFLRSVELTEETLRPGMEHMAPVTGFGLFTANAYAAGSTSSEPGPSPVDPPKAECMWCETQQRVTPAGVTYTHNQPGEHTVCWGSGKPAVQPGPSPTDPTGDDDGEGDEISVILSVRVVVSRRSWEREYGGTPDETRELIRDDIPALVRDAIANDRRRYLLDDVAVNTYAVTDDVAGRMIRHSLTDHAYLAQAAASAAAVWPSLTEACA